MSYLIILNPFSGQLQYIADTSSVVQSVTTGTGLSSSGGVNPAISIASGYYLPTTTDESNWNSKQSALGFTPENVANKTTDTTLGGVSPSNTLYPTEAAVSAYVQANISGVTGALIYKGALDLSSNPNYPAATQGWVYTVSVAGKIGGASGISLSQGDLIICSTTNGGGDQATVGSDFDTIQMALNNIVIGPTSAGANDIALFNGTTGVLIKDSGVQISTDGTLASDSDTLIPSQKAVKTYADTKVSSSSISDSGVAISTDGTMTSDSDSYVPTQKAVVTYITGTSATLTNKRITRRVNTIDSSATPSINSDTTDLFTITALATGITNMSTNLTGTPVNGDLLEIRNFRQWYRSNNFLGFIFCINNNNFTYYNCCKYYFKNFDRME